MVRSGTARLFVAVDLPAQMRAELTRWGRAAALSARASGGRLRVLEPETLHATLCFLGERPVGEITAIADTVGEACAAAAPVGPLAVGAPLWLPPRHPHALAVELHDDEESALAALRDALARTLAATVGLEARPPAERRRFRPHVTVARLRPREAPRERALPATPALSCSAPSVTLYRSWLTPAGATYEGLATHALAAAAPVGEDDGP